LFFYIDCRKSIKINILREKFLLFKWWGNKKMRDL
jgi:hypothetical protein